MNGIWILGRNLALMLVIAADGCSSRGSHEVVYQEIGLGRLVSRCPGGYGVCVMVNEYSCKDCFPVLDTALALLGEQEAGPCVYAIARAEPEAFSQRRALAQARRAVPRADSVLLDVNRTSSPDPWPPKDLQGGVFGRYDIGATPALLVLRPSGEICVLPFEALFGLDGLASDSSARWNASRLGGIIAGCEDSR